MSYTALVLGVLFLIVGIVTIMFDKEGIRFVGILSLIMGTSLILTDWSDWRIHKIKVEHNKQGELTSGYYKVHFAREEKDKKLTVVVEDSNNLIRVVRLDKAGVVGWSEEDTVLKVFSRDNVLMYNFMDAIE